ncbi:MAG: hypothetical protein HOW73_27070 [Polyangiaceae bacterium]|nr:hypothetical protein [Polyangiaceae bacterium]
MTTYGVLTDIHGNREALVAALSELDRRGVAQIVSMGDLVGYNADSDAVVELLQEREARCIAGNHDLIAIGHLETDRCWYGAAHALNTTRRTLKPRTRAFLASLPPWLVLEDHVVLLHGDLDDPQQYMRTAKDIACSAERVRARFESVQLVLYGHTHERRVFRVSGGVARRDAESPVIDTAPGQDDVVYVNPGSIDAQRKPLGKRTAEFAILDTAMRTLELVDVAYDDDMTERKAKSGGFRVGPADKLAHQSKRFLGKVRRVIDKVRPG